MLGPAASNTQGAFDAAFVFDDEEDDEDVEMDLAQPHSRASGDAARFSADSPRPPSCLASCIDDLDDAPSIDGRGRADSSGGPASPPPPSFSPESRSL